MGVHDLWLWSHRRGIAPSTQGKCESQLRLIATQQMCFKALSEQSGGAFCLCANMSALEGDRDRRDGLRRLLAKMS